MAIVDAETDVLKAIVSLVNADGELRTLFGRSSDIIRKWKTTSVGTPVPILLYSEIHSIDLSFATKRFGVQFSAFANSSETANKAVARIPSILTFSAFRTSLPALEVATDPEQPPVREWLDAESDLSDARERSDITMTFLITPY